MVCFVLGKAFHGYIVSIKVCIQSVVDVGDIVFNTAALRSKELDDCDLYR